MGEQQYSEAQLRQLGSRVEIPCFLLFIYGIVMIFKTKWSFDAMWHSYIPLVLGILGAFGAVGFRMVINQQEKSARNAGCALAGLIPYIAGCYMCFYLGVYGIVKLFSEFTITSLIASIIFTVLGWKAVNGMYRLSEIAK